MAHFCRCCLVTKLCLTCLEGRKIIGNVQECLVSGASFSRVWLPALCLSLLHHHRPYQPWEPQSAETDWGEGCSHHCSAILHRGFCYASGRVTRPNSRTRVLSLWTLFSICMQTSYGSMSAAATAATASKSCPTLCDPIDGSPPGSPVPGIPQARTLGRAAISFSNAWKWKVKVKSLSRVWLLATPWTAAYQAPPSLGFSRQEYWSGVPLPSLVSMPNFLQISYQAVGQWLSHLCYRTLGVPRRCCVAARDGEDVDSASQSLGPALLLLLLLSRFSCVRLCATP